MTEKNTKISQPTYIREEVEKTTLEYFNGDSLATDVWINKYCLKDSEGNLLEKSPDDMHWRLAKEFARVESKYENSLDVNEIYSLFKNFKYIVPQGRVMAGLGVTNSYRSLSNCLVLPTPKDSYSSIMHTDTMLVNAAKRGCGYGIDLSKLRPNGHPVKNAAITSTGIIPFMERFSNSTREVGQDSRRGACLLGIDIEHPQSMDFAKAKINRTKITGANISLKLSDEFLNAVENNENFDLKYNDKIYKTVNASEYWKEIVDVGHDNAEPGLFFWDRIINYDPVSAYDRHKIVLSNACGEQPMGELDTCRLIALNLYGFVKNPFTDNAYFDEKLFIDIVKKQIRLADDLVDLEIEYIDRIIDKVKNDPEPINEKSIEIELWKRVKEKAINGRRIGSGVTALGDMLAALNLKYDDATEFIEYMMDLKMKSELEETVQLSKERGAFPDFNYSLEYPNNVPYNDFYEFINNKYSDIISNMKQYGRRNINWSTIAPVGSVSLLTRTTSGCEPIFNVYYKRRRKTDNVEKSKFKDDNGDIWEEYNVFHPKFITWFTNNANKFIDDEYLNEFGWNYDTSVKHLEKLSIDDLNTIISKSPYYNATANEINWENRVKIQGILQKYVTSAISSTVNLPEDISKKEVNLIYLNAWKNKCKGITIYREGSRDGVLINNDSKKNESTSFNDNHAPKRPKRLKGDIIRFQNNLEKWIAVVGLLDGRPYEIFVGRLENGLSNLPTSITQCEVVKNIVEINGEKKKRYDIEYIDNNGVKYTHTGLNHTFNEEYWNYAKLISGTLRHGMPLSYVYQLVRSLNLNDEHLNTWKAGIERVIKKYVKDGEKVKGVCENCGSDQLEFKEGCLTCMACGSSKCS